MSANPQKAEPELTSKATVSGLAAPATGREALQALLAFSSLHEQIRQRRARETQPGSRLDNEDVWELEQFVLDEVLQLVAERALTITGADGVAIALAESDAIICRASAGTIAPDPGARLDPNSGFSGVCLRTGQIVRCDDAGNDARVDVEVCRNLGTRSMVAVPLSGQRGVLGLLEVFSREAYGFNDSDVRSLSLLAELILAAMRPEEENRLSEISQRVVAADPEEKAAAAEETEAADEHYIPPVSDQKDAPGNQLNDTPWVLSQYQAKKSSRPLLTIIFVLLAIALTLAAWFWWKSGRRFPLGNLQQTNSSVSAPSAPQADNPEAEGNVIAGEGDPAADHEKLGALPRVTGVRHWSATDSSMVEVQLQDQVQYEAHRLSDPERIYIDLNDTALAPGLFGKTIEVGDGLLTRVRIAQPLPGVSRIVLETKGASEFSVRMESNPYRLVIEVRSARRKPRPAEAEPSPSAHMSFPAPSTFPVRPSNRNDKPSTALPPKFRIVLDAGHGGWDLGTVGRTGLLEKDLVLDIVRRVGILVEKRISAEVIYTRQADTYVALEKRTEIANLAEANLFISIHANYSNDSLARGVETYYTNTYSSVKARPHETGESEETTPNINWTNVDIRSKSLESRRFAASVQRAMYEMMAAKTPGIRNRGVKKATYVVLTGTVMPAILAEVSFVSSPDDENNLLSPGYRQQIAEALFRGIAQYVSAARQINIASASGKSAGQ